jgi:putative beta-lysine N-acetyltransferase
VDVIETIDRSVIQHGPHNDRIYLMHLKSDNPRGLIKTLEEMAVANSYGKIFAKIPAPAWDVFQAAGYVIEAAVPGLFQGSTDGFFIAKYFSADRQQAENVPTPLPPQEPDKTDTADRDPRSAAVSGDIVSCRPADAAEMSAVYRRVFASYPFPIDSPTHLQQMMKAGAHFYCIRINEQVAAVAAADIDRESNNAEMTDFATLPQWRGMGLAGRLLNHMDRETSRAGIQTAYTIARADSVGMNRAFHNNGYRYAGLLVNNSQIGGSIRSMTVWYKHLQRA